MLRIKHTCNIPGCKRPVVSNGLCDTHRKRVERHGSTDQTRPDDWGKREKHPLYHMWLWHKSHNDELLCSEWKDFWGFVEDVEERPSKNHYLRRINPDDAYCAENCEWVEATSECKKYGAFAATYGRAYRDAKQEQLRIQHVKRHYLITPFEFAQLRKSQGDKCAICGQGEVAIVKRTGRARNLAVDHNHATGDIRGLLCTNCNKAIGHFKDNIELLAKAIVYLEQEPAIPVAKRSLKIV